MRVKRTERVINILVASVLSTILCPGILLSTNATALANQTKAVEKKKSTPVKKNRRKTTTLVPPPPPTIPSVVQSGPVSIGSTGFIDYLSKEDLIWKKGNLEKELASRKLDLEDSISILTRKESQSKNFESLYAEGVVSKRELENTRRQTARLRRDVEREQREVDEVKRVLEKIEKRLAYLEKKTKKKVKKKRGKR